MEESFSELLEKFTTYHQLRFEGERGVSHLSIIAKTLGYGEHQFSHGSPIEVFLSDNPGAQEALLNWIGEQNIPERKEGIKNELPDDH